MPSSKFNCIKKGLQMRWPIHTRQIAIDYFSSSAFVVNITCKILLKIKLVQLIIVPYHFDYFLGKWELPDLRTDSFVITLITV